MTRAQIIAMQERIGTPPDGFWGPKSIAALQLHLRAIMPKSSPWPGTSQAALQGFYGSPGDATQHTSIDVTGLGVRYDGKPVKSITCHRKVADSLLAIITTLSKIPDGRAVLAQYAGVYNNRPMRGGSLPSLHARAAAIDLAPATNGNFMHWPTRATMPLAVIEVFARHGWTSAGAWWHRDAMHFQATRP